VPAEYAAGVYDDLMAVGADLGVRSVGLSAMSSLRLEKGYRDFGVDIDNTDNPLEAGLGFTVAWDKPGGFVGRDALVKARAEGPPRNRVVSLLAEDPIVDLFGNEPVRRHGEWVGYVRAAAFGHTMGAAVGLAQVTCRDGVTAEWLREGGFSVRSGSCGDVPVRLQLGPLYDPRRMRILA
jgi:glycine cleavage system aminomethyltransferase T